MSLKLVRMAVVAFASLLIIAGIGAALGQASGEFAVFNAHDPGSKTVITYNDWNRFLRIAVYDVGPSHRYRPEVVVSERTGTKLNSRRSRSPSWIEGNRIRFHLFSDNTLDFLERYKNGMVRVAEREDIVTWSRDEQLAFWLNLHNVLVMKVATEEYPFRNARRLHRKYWDQDAVTIKGVSLSIRDIESEIVLAIWDNPMVIYGFYEVAIGGPSLRPLALTSRSVWLSLNRNGRDFVNSNRAVNSWGNTVRISEYYGWMKKIFPDFRRDLDRHLRALANDKTKAILDRSARQKISYFDWYPTDFYAGMMADGMDSNVVSRAAITAVSGKGGAIPPAIFVQQIPNHEYPSHARDFMRTLQLKFRTFHMDQAGMSFAEMMQPTFKGTVTVVELPRVEGTSDEEN